MKTNFLIYKKNIFQKLDEIKLSDFNIFLAVSGGSDSMFMFYMVEEYLKLKNLDKKKINILHFNHKYRKESDEECDFLKIFFGEYNFIYGEHEGKDFAEETLRKKRYEFFSQNIEKFTISGKDSVICLGHNIDDRVETSFLNIVRGCSLEGFSNMEFFSQGFVEKTKNGQNNKIIFLRPILDIPKFQIKNFCDVFEIPYFEDKTNMDNDISVRNFVRNEIISRLVQISNKNKDGIPKLYDSFGMIYNQITSVEENKYSLKEITTSKEWEAEYGYVLDFLKYDLNNVVQILKHLGIYFNISQTMLQEFLSFFQNSQKGYKYLNGVYFFKSHGKIYVIKASLYFRQKKLAHIKKIDKIGIYKIGGIEIKIEEEKYVGGILRYAQEGDVYKSKKINKYFINQKVPVFWRNFVPLLVKDGKVQKIFIDIIK